MAQAQPVKWVVTANNTGDAAVVYMRADQSFTTFPAQAALYETKDEAEAMRKVALKVEHIVSDPYLMEVAVTPNGLDLLSARERIRATGPTVPVRRANPPAA